MAPVGGLLERDDVIGSLDGLLDGVAAGRSGSLFVLGEAGLGKTSLIDRAGRLAAEAGLTVGLGRGHPMETSLPFGLLTQGLDGVGARGLLGEDQPEPAMAGDRAARFYGVLRWLQDRTDRRIFLAFDDMQWADADSLALISFICRRSDSLGLGLIGGLRPWPPEASETVAGVVHEGRGTLQRLAPLSEPAAASLLESRLGRSLPADIKRRAFRLCAGNPLLLGQLAVAIGKGEDLPAATGPARAAFGQGVLLARFAGLPAAGMRCAQAASVLGTSFLPEIAAQVAGLDGADIDTALESLGRTGLIDQSPGAEADFVHPLFRQALYDDLAGPVRTRMHARAFTVLRAHGLESQAAEHAIQARMAGDREAVSVLERAGRASRRAGAMATAVARFDAAVAMAGDWAGLGLLRARAEALLAAGQAERAVSTYQLLLSRGDVQGRGRVEALWMLARALVMAGHHDLAADTFSAAADLAAADDPATAAGVLLDAAFCGWLTAGPVRALPLASRARELARPLGGELATRAEADWGQITMQTGDPAGMAAAEAGAPWRQSRRAPGPDADVLSAGAGAGAGVLSNGGGWAPINSFAYCACLVERLAEADRAFAAIRAALQRTSLPEGIASLAVGHSYVLCRMGRLAAALEAVSVALPLVELVPLMESFASVGMAYISLHIGKLDDSTRWCERTEASATPRGELQALLFLWDVLGHRRLREGAAAEACELYARLEATVSRMGIGEPCLPPWARHGISAYLAGGRISDAERVLGWLDQAASRLPCRFPRIAAATGRAQLAELAGDQAAAEAHFRSALVLHEQVDLPLEYAETLLAYGGFLRRSGRPAAARPLLAQSAGIAQAAGASWLAGLAADELRVAGGRRRRRSSSALSAQEQRVARLAAGGAANAEIARQLYVSVKTVETHLEHIYAKLGIHSRYELMAMASNDGWRTET